MKYLFFVLLIISAIVSVAQTNYQQAAGFSYLEAVKGNANPGDNLPVIIGLHYSSSTPQEAATDYDSIKIPVRLILPKGNFRRKDGYTYFPPDYYSKDSLAQMPIARQTLDSMAAFVKAIGEKYNAKPIIAGFSQGGDLSFLLAVYYPQLIKAAFPLAGFMHRQRWEDAKKYKQKSVPIMIYQGEADKIISIHFTRKEVKALRPYFNIILTSYPGLGHDYNGDMKRDYAQAMSMLFK